MALIAHWPLNGNTNDISGNGYNPTTVGSVTYVPGKIGSAGLFDGTSDVCYINSTIQQFENVFNNNSSISFWYKLKSASTAAGVLAMGPSGTNTRLHLVIRAEGNFAIGFYANDFNTTFFPVIDQWYHYTIILDKKNMKQRLFIDGVFHSERNVSSFLEIPSGSSFELGGYSGSAAFGELNDVRVYDHALTDMEIQEIARAKILHYTFDDFQEPTTNLIGTVIDTTFETTTGLSLSSTVTVSDEIKFNNHKVYKIEPDSDSSGFSITSNIWINQDDIVNLSFWVYIPSDQIMTRTWEIHRHMLPDGSCIGGNCHHYNSIDYTNKDWDSNSPKNQWFRRDITIQADLKDGTYTIINGFWARIFAYSGQSIAGDGYFYVTEPQIEKKNYPTEFTTLSRIGNVNDYSGFFNISNLSEEYSPRWITDSKIGAGAYYFNDSNNIIKKISNTIYSPENITVNLWFKSSDTGFTSYHIPFSWGSLHIEISINTSGNIRTGFYIDGVRRVYNSGSGLLDGNWHMLTSVFDGTLMKAYIDGVKTGEWSHTGSLTRMNSTLSIGEYSGYGNKNAYEDDVRIYATALSDADILDLYQTRAEIEESGVLYARNLLSNARPVANLLGTTGADASGSGTWSMNAHAGWTWEVSNLSPDREHIWHVQHTTTDNEVFYPTNYNFVPKTYLGERFVFIFEYKFNSTSTTGFSGSFYQDGWKLPAENQTAELVYSESIPLLDGWTRVVWMYQVDYAGTPVFRFNTGYTTNIVDLYIDNMMLYRGTEIVPFINSYRPAIQLPSTLDFAGNEVHETGTANFEDFSTVGITDGLVGYWQLNNDVKDYSGNNYNGTNNGAVSKGDYYYFNDAAKISLPELPSFSEISIIAKIRRIGSTNWEGIFGTEASILHFQLEASGKLNAYLYGTVGLGLNSGTHFITADDNWHMVVLTFDNTNLRFYVDNEFDAEAIDASPGGSIPASSLYRIGLSHDTTRYFNGDIAYVKLFNRALTPEEIAIEYNTMFNNEVQIHESGVLYAKDIKQY